MPTSKSRGKAPARATTKSPGDKGSPTAAEYGTAGDGDIATRKIAILLANGVEEEPVTDLIDALTDAGAVTRLLSMRLGTVTGEGGEPFEIDATMENSPAVLFDAMVLAGGAESVDALSRDGHTLEFVKDQYRHCKTILALGDSSRILSQAGIPMILPSGETDPGLLVEGQENNEARGDSFAEAFIAAIGLHRHVARDQDPPII
jgi:catalase